MSMETIKSGNIHDPSIWREVKDGKNEMVIRHTVEVVPGHVYYGGSPEASK